LGWLLPGGVRGESILADLEEEYEGREEGVTRDLWYGREALRLVVHYRVLAPGREVGAKSKMGRGSGMGGIVRDLAYAFRRLRRDPLLMGVAVLTMGLGIGSAVAIFAVVDAVLLEPLPYEEPEALVAIFEADLDRGVTRNVANAGNAREWEAGAPSIQEIAGAVMPMPTVLEVVGEPREVVASPVTPNYFQVLGMEPEIGRLMVPDAGGSGDPEILLSHRFWTTAFGTDPGVVGRSLDVNGVPHTVVGVLPPDYVAFGEGSAFYRSVPTELMGDQTNSGRYLWVVARLVPGATAEGLQQELDGISRGMQEAYPDFNAGWTARAVPLHQDVVGDAAAGLWLLLVSVGLLLAIACGNVASLLLSRATARRSEMAVRSCLGATGQDLGRQLLVESGVLAFAGGLAGVVLAYAGTRLLAGRMPDVFALPRVEHAAVDGTVLVFALAVSVFTGLVFGMIPALQVRRAPPARVLSAEGRGPSRGTGHARNLLVVAEVALSLVLLVGAGLVGRSLGELSRVDSGVDPKGVLAARVNLQGGAYPETAERQRFFATLLERIEAEAGVEAAGANTFLPMVGSGAATSFYDAGAPPPPREDWPTAGIRNVEGDYFAAMGISLVEGRLLGPSDRAGSTQVVVVNEALARDLWPDESAVGRRLAINWGPLEEPWEVVGVVEDVRMVNPSQPALPAIYHPYGQAAYFPFMHVAVRTRGRPADFAPVLRSVLRELDPTVALAQPVTMTDVVGDAVARPRMTTTLMAIFACVAAALAAVGLYGVLSYTVSRRVREIGLRMAVGADGGRVLGMVVAQGMGMVALGLVLGTLVAYLGSRFLSSLLFGVSPRDPWTFGVAIAGLAFTSLLASLIPAWRATRVQPAEALRGS
jgi:predicted permease